MTPRARLVVPALLGLGLTLGIALAARPAAALSPPCNERTTYVDCRSEAECRFEGGGVVCDCDWDSVSDIAGLGGRDICSGKNEQESMDIACKVWDAEKYPDQPFCKPRSCENRGTLADCVNARCLAYYDAQGVRCDPATCAFVEVRQEECDCNWDYPTYNLFGLHCDTFMNELGDSGCWQTPNGAGPYCTANPLLHCAPAALCDADGNGRVDSVDVDAIYARLGQPASVGCDPADSTESGEISIVDASRCTEQCTYANCATSAPSGGGGCGIGPELALLLPLLARLRGRRRGPAAA